MTKIKFLTTIQVAKITGLSAGYLAYLRTDVAKEKHHHGPNYFRVDLRDGSANPIRIKYDAKAVAAWTEERRLRAAQRPVIEHVQG